ncbi:MAG TPA: rod shape-determining protein RodA [Coriobacteriia bacterium]|nr:rod shape-determining protein RodA [Coriobacteriia bacterium]
MNERSAILRVMNPALVAAVMLLAVFGSVMVSSAVSGMDAGSGMFKRHLFGLLIGLIPLVAAWVFDYRRLQGWVGPLLLLDALLILSPRIPGLGAAAKGATSWLQIGGIRLFQPSEPAKLVTILVMAAIIARYNGRIEKPRDVAKILGVLAIPLGLILLQPDLGTGLVFVAITAGMLLIGGLQARWFAILGLAGIVLVSGLFWLNATLDRTTGEDKLIKNYQLDRLMVFVDPSADPKGAGYNLEQSKIAIGSGEVTGKGIGSGTQGNLNFLPERHTDFIFSVLGEELGFLGAAILLGLYLILLVTALEISASSRDLFGALIVAGIISMWTFQILENVGMTIGLMPITGIPLPFMSFGSSFMVTNMMATGMLLSVWARRYA